MPAETAPAGVGGPEAADALESLPEGSEAAKRVKYSEQKRLASFTFQSKDGQKTSFQVTAKQAGSSAERAQQIAQLCYAKFEAGLPKEQVTAYRDELCGKPGGTAVAAGDAAAGAKRPAPAAAGEPKASPKASPKKRPRSGGDGGGGGAAASGGDGGGGESLLEVLQREGRLKGALRIDGRVASKKNHEAINGIFALLPGGYEGRNAYEKVVMGGSGLESCKRFLYFSASGKKWKISDVLGDGKGGYCYVRAKDGGQTPPVVGGQGDAAWFVFDGKEAGYKADAAVQSSLLEPAAASPRKAAAEAADADDSSSSSSSSSDEEENAEPPSQPSPPQASQPSQPSQPLPDSQPSQPPPRPAAVASAAAAASAPICMEPETPSKVCAKAAVRSGLRCACHYSYADECPARKR